jgi:hypothetical protein
MSPPGGPGRGIDLTVDAHALDLHKAGPADRRDRLRRLRRGQRDADPAGHAAALRDAKRLLHDLQAAHLGDRVRIVHAASLRR